MPLHFSFKPCSTPDLEMQEAPMQTVAKTYFLATEISIRSKAIPYAASLFFQTVQYTRFRCRKRRCKRRCLTQRTDFSSDKPKVRRNTLCISRDCGAVRGKRCRCGRCMSLQRGFQEIRTLRPLPKQPDVRSRRQPSRSGRGMLRWSFSYR